jgi:hypothetical protein
MSVILNANTSSGFIQTADTSGTIELQSNGTTKLTVSSSGVNIGQMNGGAITSGTVNGGAANPLSGGTSVDFTSIPSWVKRITVMFSGVSTSGTNLVHIQLGTGAGPTFVATGYNSPSMTTGASSMNTVLATTGFIVFNPSGAGATSSGTFVLTNLTGNTWTGFGSLGETSGTRMFLTSGALALGAVLTAIRITTVDTFDAGSINILYEG